MVEVANSQKRYRSDRFVLHTSYPKDMANSGTVFFFVAKAKKQLTAPGHLKARHGHEKRLYYGDNSRCDWQALPQ